MIYKMLLKSTWTHGIQLYGSASNSNIDIFQGVPWYVNNSMIHRDGDIDSLRSSDRVQRQVSFKVEYPHQISSYKFIR